MAVAGRRLASVAEITVVRAGVERLDELVGFWKLLHRHQSSVAAAVPGLDVLSESDSAVIVGKMYREWLSSPDSVAFLAEEDGRLVGYVVGFYDEPHFMWSTGRVGHIDSFYVLPELRGRGVGRLLMEASYAEMRQAGATRWRWRWSPTTMWHEGSTSKRASRPHSSRCTGGSALIRSPDVTTDAAGRTPSSDDDPPNGEARPGLTTDSS